MTMMIVIIVIIHTSPIVQTIIILIGVISIIPVIIHITQWYELKINWIVN